MERARKTSARWNFITQKDLSLSTSSHRIYCWKHETRVLKNVRLSSFVNLRWRNRSRKRLPCCRYRHLAIRSHTFTRITTTRKDEIEKKNIKSKKRKKKGVTCFLNSLRNNRHHRGEHAHRKRSPFRGSLIRHFQFLPSTISSFIVRTIFLDVDRLPPSVPLPFFFRTSCFHGRTHSHLYEWIITRSTCKCTCLQKKKLKRGGRIPLPKDLLCTWTTTSYTRTIVIV